MLKTSKRVCGILLIAMMIASMLSVVTFGYSGAVNDSDYYTVDYDSLVGTANQAKKGVYVVNAAWVFEEGEAPATVTFRFRNKTITETYNPNRHLADYDEVYPRAEADEVELPVCILTEGNYSKTMNMDGSIIILGARAGLNPNVQVDDPTQEWLLSGSRALTALDSEDSRGETRVWTKTQKAYASDANDFYGFNVMATVGNRTYVIDGVTLQGYGGVVRDMSTGTSTIPSTGVHNVYVQNTIMNDGWAYDCETLRFWGRTSNINTERHLFVSNSYITNQKTRSLYSGHATSLCFKSNSFQRNYGQGFIYNAHTLNIYGFNAEFYNNHLWNPAGWTSNTSYSLMMFGLSSLSQISGVAATDEELVSYKFYNNSFYNVEIETGSSYGLIRPSVAGNNTRVEICDNIFVQGKESTVSYPIGFAYVHDQQGNNTFSASWAGNGNKDSVATSSGGTFPLNSTTTKIQGNTMVGKDFQRVPAIGSNTNPATDLAMEGNLYLASMTDTAGKLLPGTAQVYDQWTWLDAAKTKKSSDLYESDFVIHDANVQLSGTEATLNLASNQKSYTLDMTCHEENSVRVYQSDSSFQKGEALADFTLDTSARTSYYVISLLSVDKRTSKDYHLTVNRAPGAGAVLSGITVDASVLVEGQSGDADHYYYTVNYDSTRFVFTPQVPEGATVTARLLLNQNVVIRQDSAGKLTLGINQVGVFPYTITVTNGADEEVYDLSVERLQNAHADITNISVAGSGNTAAYNEEENLWVITGAATTLSLKFYLTLSTNATVQIKDVVYGSELVADNTYNTNTKHGYYVVSDLNNTRYIATVTAQNGVVQQTYTILVTRPQNDACTLLGIEDAEKVDDTHYVANVNVPKFFVNALRPEKATYEVYADALGKDRITNHFLTLTAATTEVWVRVIAENGIYKSDIVTLTINTTADLSGNGEVTYGAMVGNDVIGVTGNPVFNENQVEINLKDGAKQLFLKVVGLNGYEAHVYADLAKTLESPAEQILTPDSGNVLFYVVATNGDSVKNYTISVKSTRKAQYTDTIADWAKPYVDQLNNTGLGLMQGDEHGAFNGGKNLTRYEMVTLLVRLLGADRNQFASVTLPFSDTIVDWAANYVKAAYRLGLVSGTGVTDDEGNVISYVFQGAKNATRAEFLRVLMNARLYGSTDIDSYYAANQKMIDAAFKDKKFADADDVADWAKSAVYTSVALGIIAGDNNNKVNPGANITRNEVATLLARVLVG